MKSLATIVTKKLRRRKSQQLQISKNKYSNIAYPGLDPLKKYYQICGIYEN
jgi:hypothetical protein